MEASKYSKENQTYLLLPLLGILEADLNIAS
jgi:hypothetical protein